MLFVLALAAKILLSAPTSEQTNLYRLREEVTESGQGTVVMTGTERRHISAPVKGKRTVHISFDVSIAEQPASTTGRRWAAAQAKELSEADDGFLDDRDRLTLSDGVAVDSYPMFPAAEAAVGGTWEQTFNDQPCKYTLSKLEAGVARIEIVSDSKARGGKVHRAGFWTVETASGRLLSWNIHTEASFMGRTAVVNSTGEILNKPG